MRAPEDRGRQRATSSEPTRPGAEAGAGKRTLVEQLPASGGAALPADRRAEFERSLGADLGGVRVHTGAASADAARSIGARAFTRGNDIHFGAGQYDPSSPAGNKLLAHEVAHTAQQAGGDTGVQAKHEVGSPHDPAEHEADRAAEAMLAGAPARVTTGARGIQRVIDPADPYADLDAKPTAPAPAYDFSDDPLSAGGFGPDDARMLVRPGAARTTLIRPRSSFITPLQRSDGGTFTVKNPDKGAWIQAFLTFFSFSEPWVDQDPAGGRCRFNGKASTLTEVIDITIQQATLADLDLAREDVSRVAPSLMNRFTPRPVGPGIPKKLILTYSFVSALHRSLTGDRSNDPAGNQAAIGVSWQLRPENKPGWELSMFGQTTVFREPDGRARLENITAGGQASYVLPLVKGFLELSLFAQLVSGVARTQRTTDGVIVLAPTVQVTPLPGAQLTFTIPGTSGKLKIGGQLAPQFTTGMGDHLPATFDFGGGGFLQVEIGL